MVLCWLSIITEATKAENFGIPFLIYKIANLIYLFILIWMILKATKKLFFWRLSLKLMAEQQKAIGWNWHYPWKGRMWHFSNSWSYSHSRILGEKMFSCVYKYICLSLCCTFLWANVCFKILGQNGISKSSAMEHREEKREYILSIEISFP